MIASLFIKNILQLLVDEVEMLALKEQLNFIEINKIDYSGQGVFIKFKTVIGIENFKFSKEEKVINGVEIKSSQLPLGGGAILFISHGLIDYLEIWSYNGEYPKEELNDYVLKQAWQGSPGRQINSDN